MLRRISLLTVDGLRPRTGEGTDAVPGMQEVRDHDPFRLGEKPGGDDDRLLMRDGERTA